jgi:hypothetical protein
MMEFPGSAREFFHVLRQGRKAALGRPVIHGMTEVQVAERAHLTVPQLLARLQQAAPRAARNRRRLPAPLRLLPTPQEHAGARERWRLGYLFDVILTRDIPGTTGVTSRGQPDAPSCSRQSTTGAWWRTSWPNGPAGTASRSNSTCSGRRVASSPTATAARRPPSTPPSSAGSCPAAVPVPGCSANQCRSDRNTRKEKIMQIHKIGRDISVLSDPFEVPGISSSPSTPSSFTLPSRWSSTPA